MICWARQRIWGWGYRNSKNMEVSSLVSNEFKKRNHPSASYCGRQYILRTAFNTYITALNTTTSDCNFHFSRFGCHYRTSPVFEQTWAGRCDLWFKIADLHSASFPHSLERKCPQLVSHGKEDLLSLHAFILSISFCMSVSIQSSPSLQGPYLQESPTWTFMSYKSHLFQYLVTLLQK